MRCAHAILFMLAVLAAAAGAGAEPSGKGKLTVVTTPWTKVEVDGEQVGNTPVMGHTVDAGKHEVTLVNESYSISFSMSVTVKDGEEKKISHSFEIETTKGDGLLNVSTTPWTEVYVDGEFLGNTPIQGHRLEPGKHTIKLVNEGLGISEKLGVTIEDGMDTTISKQLTTKPKTGTLSVTAHPWAKVFVNGVELGSTPIVKHRLEPGKHKVKLVNDKLGITKTFTVKIVKGEDTKLVKNLTEKGDKGPTGTLSVTTTPWTVVYVDGKKVGSSPLIKHKLKAGAHTVKLVNKDLEIQKVVKVTIKKGEHTQIVKDLL